MATGTAHRLRRTALLAFLAGAAALIVLESYNWLAASLADATLPIVLIVVPLVTLASLLAPGRRQDR